MSSALTADAGAWAAEPPAYSIKAKRKAETALSKRPAKRQRVNPTVHDQFFTKPEYTDMFIETTVKVIGAENIQVYWDPSAGSGDAALAVARLVPDVHLVLWDIDPRFTRDNVAVAKRDALASPPTETEHGHWASIGKVLGGFNPPYGVGSRDAVKFVKMMAAHCDYIVMLVPSIVMLELEKHFDLLHKESVAFDNVFYYAENKEDFNYETMLWIGRRKAATVEVKDNYKSVYAEIKNFPKFVFDPERPPAEQDPVRHISNKMLIQRVGKYAARQVFVRDPTAGEFMWRMVGMKDGVVSVGEATSDFIGWAVVSNNGNWKTVRAKAGPAETVDWVQVARDYVSTPLPEYTEWGGYPSMRVPDMSRRLDRAIALQLPGAPGPAE